ncbi:sensor histidine kinase [Xylanimonas ulmi]|uniref:histidine kinase n=1 Tax=Xylanimonas ulmi TaxID=228973 RepID=A0A4Q7M5J7_9MICO|nr:histidine kinase [Xylanibacterium ulmi]RZS63265.1 histidine kinase [Xylanibacterium ulmi]
MASPTPAPGSPLQSRARHVWGEAWRVVVAGLVGVAGFALPGAESERTAALAEVPVEYIAPDPGFLLLDAALGVASLGLLLLRRRAPLTIACVLAAFTTLGGAPAGAWTIAVVSLATHRRWRRIAVAMVPALAATVGHRLLSPLAVMPEGGDRIDALVRELITAAVLTALLVAIGAYIGARRDLVRSLRERAAAAELEQARRTEQARAGERARIAREMHDVLAHRMSLVAMHAGALTYREGLSPQQVREAASVIRDSAHQALDELRDVLGVLREEGAARPSRPQPTLADLDDLVAEARAAGCDVRLPVDLPDVTALASGVSRSAFRILQEALTNARKHAPGAPVRVEVSGDEADGLSLLISNPAPVASSAGASAGHGARASAAVAPALPASGLGLAGLVERAELAGGSLSFGERAGRFLVRAWLPWTT